MNTYLENTDMYLKRENYKAKLQAKAQASHTDVAGVFENLRHFKPNRLPYELICELLEGGDIGIDVCPYGDLIYNTDYSNYADTYKRISNLLVKYGYQVCSWKGTIFKKISTDEYDAVGEIR